MENKVSQLFKLYIFIGLFSGITAECPIGWFHYGNSCFFFSHEKLNWYLAESSCRGHNARLAEPESKDVSDFLISTVKTIQGNSGSTPYYLGGRDDVIEGTWVWASTDNIMKYTAWGPGEPNGQTGSNCLTMYHTLQWKWSDDPCKAEFFFVCEKIFHEPGTGTEIIG